MAEPDVNEDERDIGAAARAFQEGQKAQLAGDFARAAQLFELADEIAPTPEAIRSAIRNRDAAEHPARAATLALAALARYPQDAETDAIASQVLDRVGPSLARLSVSCDAPCALLLDGEAMSARPIERADVYVPPGAHRLEARFDSERKLSRPLELAAGAHEQLELALPPAPEPPPMAIEQKPFVRDVVPRPPPARAPERDFEGLSPWLAGSAGALTIGCATAALITGLDAMRKRDAYEADPTRERYERGYTSQKWTNALWVATGGLAATSIVLLAFTDWDGDEQRSTATLSLSPLAANFVVRSSLP